METAGLKKFAQSARSSLKKQVSSKLTQVLADDSAARRESPASVSALEGAISAESKEAVIDRVAYTWFNRFCALRFMDANGYTRIGIVSPAEGHSQPEILAEAKMGHIDEAMVPDRIAKQVYALLDGSAPSRDPQAEAYRLLLVAACNSYHAAMPYLFERIEDYTELLMPDDLLSASSILADAREAMTDQACENVEVIGWLYQFYISEKKDQVIGKVVKSEDIPAATQLFTPNWIVKYMVQNSLGAQWLATYPDSPLKGQMEYYIEPAKQTDEVNAQLAAITPDTLKPEELTLIDPACGSGHILTEAYDLFKAIYLERGYQQRDVAKLILEKNLFGLEICPRAAQLTGFALMMKARADDRRIFDQGVQLNVMALQDSKDFDAERLAQGVNLADYDLKTRDLTELKDLFEHATTFGSLAQVPKELTERLPVLRQLTDWQAPKNVTADVETNAQLDSLKVLMQQAELLAAHYDAVVANPPYMGGGGMNSWLKKFLKDHYKGYEKDLFSAFIDRGLAFSRAHGRLGFMSPFVWMFISSYEHLRVRLITNETITSLIQLEYSGFEGATVPICTFTLQKGHVDKQTSCFIRLSDFRGAANQGPKTLEAIANRNCGWFFETCQDEFRKIPGSPVTYWVSDRILHSFQVGRPVGLDCSTRKGMATGLNAEFVRAWHEVQVDRIGFRTTRDDAKRSGLKWFPYANGGAYRKWYGHYDDIVNWESDGRRLQTEEHESGRIRAVNLNLEYIFKPGLSWTSITSGSFSIRSLPAGFLFSSASNALFHRDGKGLGLYMALLNSNVHAVISKALNPTLNANPGDIGKIPVVACSEMVSDSARQLIGLSRADWDAYERSWDFQSFPLLTDSSDRTPTLESSYTAWITQNRDTIAEMKRLEEENNRLFIDAYGLQDELTPDVSIEQITLTVNPAYRYGGKLTEKEQWTRFRQDTMQEFISYAVGCMFGRYALEKPGLILANHSETVDEYLKQIPKPSFPADDDNVIPILDGNWFADDITGRFLEFLKVTFGEEHFEENVKFIEDALGKNLRKYFLKSFYTDHVKTYKKRPIYWLFSSPKGSFNALIYMHRYRPDTVSVVLNDYLREFRTKLSARKSHLEAVSISAGASQAEKTKALREIDKLNKVIEETEEYEREVLYPLATEQVEIDLDDGVKVNYNKFGTALKKIAGLTAK